MGVIGVKNMDNNLWELYVGNAYKYQEHNGVPNTETYMVHDHLGNMRIAFNATAGGNQLTSAMDYYPFGKILREYVAGQAERYLTTGNERDPETDFDYRNARFYDAEIGRFLSVDPLTSEMPEWSPYNFVFSNPIRFVDPRGLAPEWEEDGEGNLIVDENDDVQSLAEYLNISSTEAYEIFGNLDNWIAANGQKAVSGVGNIKGFSLKIPSVRNAETQGDSRISIDESHNRIGFIPLDVGSNYGAYQMANYQANISIRGNQDKIFVGVTNFNSLVSGGQVVFNANASLSVDGDVIQSQSLVNGSAWFNLQSGSNISLTVKGGWIVYFDSGGASVPVYHPVFWPFSLNFTDDFNLK